jgi:hypothetical protein
LNYITCIVHQWVDVFTRKDYVEILTQEFFNTKVSYIHLNPVRAGLVFKEEEYTYSSCCDYYGTANGLIELAER